MRDIEIISAIDTFNKNFLRIDLILANLEAELLQTRTKLEALLLILDKLPYFTKLHKKQFVKVLEKNIKQRKKEIETFKQELKQKLTERRIIRP